MSNNRFKKGNHSFLSSNSGILLFSAIIAISTASILIRKAQVTIPSLSIAVYRLGFSSLFLIPLSLRKKIIDYKKLEKRNLPIALISGFFLAFHFISWIYSLKFTSVISSVVIVTTTPIWVSIFSATILREKVNRKIFFGLLWAFFGVLIISFGSRCSFSDNVFSCLQSMLGFDQKTIAGNLLALSGAVCAAIYIICGRKLRKELSNISYITLIYTITGFILLVIAIATGQLQILFTFQEWIYLLLLALIPQLIGHSLINEALGRLPAVIVSVSLLGEPVGSTVLAMVFLNEIPSLMEWIGSAVILSGILFVLKTKE